MGDVTGKDQIRDAIQSLLEAFNRSYGLDTDDENFRETPDRVARAYEEILAGVSDTDQQGKKVLSKSFPCKSDSMVTVSGIRTYSLCPHHLQPVEYETSAAYIPSTNGGEVVGLSKIPRLVEILSKRPVLHEQLAADIVDALASIPGCRGSACYMRGRHFCMVTRGARQHAAVTTVSAMRGVFLEDSGAKSEFLDLARQSVKSV